MILPLLKPILEGRPNVLLEVKNLSVVYGHAMAIETASFSVAAGEIVAMLGQNGAGKSTALRAVSGVLAAAGGKITGGEVLCDGRSTLGLRPDQLVAMGISLVPEGRRVFTSMTVQENLEMGAFLLRDPRKTKNNMDRVLAMFEPLQAKLSKKAGTLSGGEQQMLSLGRALMIEPKLLLVDEPSLGLSPNYVEIVFDKLRDINRSGASILLVEQNASMALDICDRAYVFEMGKIALEGTRNSLLEDSRVQDLFFATESNE
jgi:branched-chain amino acid transport system ATP-binding protein